MQAANAGVRIAGAIEISVLFFSQAGVANTVSFSGSRRPLSTKPGTSDGNMPSRDGLITSPGVVLAHPVGSLLVIGQNLYSTTDLLNLRLAPWRMCSTSTRFCSPARGILRGRYAACCGTANV
jgi:hypothetical protein